MTATTTPPAIASPRSSVVAAVTRALVSTLVFIPESSLLSKALHPVAPLRSAMVTHGEKEAGPKACPTSRRDALPYGRTSITVAPHQRVTLENAVRSI